MPPSELTAGRDSVPKPLSLNRTRWGGTLKRVLTTFRQLVNTTATALGVICGVGGVGSLGMALLVHRAFLFVAIAFGLVGMGLAYLNRYATKIVGYVGVGVQVLDYDARTTNTDQLMDEFKGAFGRKASQKLGSFIGVNGKLDINNGVREFIFAAVQSLLIDKLKLFVYAPGAAAMALGVVTAVMSQWYSHVTFVHGSFIFISIALLALGAGGAAVGHKACDTFANKLRQLLSVDGPSAGEIDSSDRTKDL